MRFFTDHMTAGSLTRNRRSFDSSQQSLLHVILLSLSPSPVSLWQKMSEYIIYFSIKMLTISFFFNCDVYFKNYAFICELSQLFS